GGAWVWTHQNALRDDLPRTQLNAVLARADSALAAGKLSGSPDSARDQYEAALALDPDSEHAIAGLRNVGHAELKRAEEDIGANRLDEARTALEEARGLLGGGDEVAQTESALNKADNRGTTADTLIDRANAALQAGNLEGKAARRICSIACWYPIPAMRSRATAWIAWARASPRACRSSCSRATAPVRSVRWTNSRPCCRATPACPTCARRCRKPNRTRRRKSSSTSRRATPTCTQASSPAKATTTRWRNSRRCCSRSPTTPRRTRASAASRRRWWCRPTPRWMRSIPTRHRSCSTRRRSSRRNPPTLRPLARACTRLPRRLRRTKTTRKANLRRRCLVPRNRRMSRVWSAGPMPPRARAN